MEGNAGSTHDKIEHEIAELDIVDLGIYQFHFFIIIIFFKFKVNNFL